MNKGNGIVDQNNHPKMGERGGDIVSDKTPPLREMVLERLRTMIYSGELQPGDRLVERELAQQFSVSRLPVREALRMLRQDGVVEELATRGSRVKVLSRKDVEDLFDLREALETMTFRLAAARITPVEVGKLHKCLERTALAVSQQHGDRVRMWNRRFHEIIIVAANNPLLQRELGPLEGRFQWLSDQAQDFAAVASEHAALLEALESHDQGGAEAAAREHVRRNRERVLQQLFHEA